jgi:hypothetical protein
MEPTGQALTDAALHELRVYGLGCPGARTRSPWPGRSGWVTATFAPGVAPPLDPLKDWIDESYRAVAPKSLVKQLGRRD